MPAQKTSSGVSFMRHIAPFAPVALALAMSTATKPAKPTASFSPECTLPFDRVRNPPADDHCGIAGGNSDIAKQEEAKAKNDFCAATESARVITYQELVDL